MQQLNLKTSHKPVTEYYKALGQFKSLRVSHETAVRSARSSTSASRTGALHSSGAGLVCDRHALRHGAGHGTCRQHPRRPVAGPGRVCVSNSGRPDKLSAAPLFGSDEGRTRPGALVGLLLRAGACPRAAARVG